MATCNLYNDLEQKALDAQMEEHIDAVNIVEDNIIGRIFPRNSKGQEIISGKVPAQEQLRVKLLKEIRTMLMNKIEKNPQFADAFLKRIIFTFKHARPGKMNDQALSTTRAIHKGLKRTLKLLDQTQGVMQRVASSYSKEELQNYIKQWEETGQVTQLPPKLGSPKSWVNYVLDKYFKRTQVKSPQLLAFDNEPTGWAAKIVLDSMFLQDSATILARPFRENIADAYQSAIKGLEFHFGRTDTSEGVSRINTYFGPMLDEDGESLGDIDTDSSHTSRERLSRQNFLAFIHNIMRGKTRMIKPMEMAIADDATRKVILDRATRKIVRYKGTDGEVRTLSGNVFTYRGKDGKVDDNFILFKFLKPGKDGKRKVIRLKTKNLIPVQGRVIQDAGYTTTIMDDNGNENKYVFIKRYDSKVEYYEAYKLGFRVDIDSNGNEIITDEPALNTELNEMTEQYGFNYAGNPNGEKVMFMEAEVDNHSHSENVYEKFDANGKLTNHRKKRYWSAFRPMDSKTEFFNHGTYMDENFEPVVEQMNEEQQMRALIDVLFRDKDVVEDLNETPKAGVFATVRELRHILSGKVKDDVSDTFDTETAGFGYDMLSQIQEMQRELENKLTTNFQKAKHHLIKQGMDENDVYNYLLGLEDVGGYNPYQNLSVNIQLDENDNVVTPNSYMGRDNMYFPDIYEDVVYREKLMDSIANTKAQIMSMLEDVDSDTIDTNDILGAIDNLDAQDEKKEALQELRNDLVQLQARLDMAYGNDINDDAKSIMQNKSKHGRHRGQMMDRNDARLDANVLNEYVSDMFRSMLVNDVKADFYGAIVDVNPEWRTTIYEQIASSIGMPNNRAGILGIDYRDEKAANFFEPIHKFLYRNWFDREGEPLNANSIARMGVAFSKMQTANLMSTQTFLRNTGQTWNKYVGQGWDTFQLARDMANDKEVQYYAARSGVLSLESFLGDAVFTAASVDWFTGATAGRLEWLSVYLSRGDEGVLDTFGKELTEQEKVQADLFLYRLMLKQEQGSISSKKVKEEASKFGKDAYQYIKVKAKRKRMLRNSVDDSVLLERMKNPKVRRQLEELKTKLGEFIKFDPESMSGNYKTDERNLRNELKAIKFKLSMNAINKLVQSKLNRYYSNPGPDGKAYGDDVFTLSGTEQRLRIEDFAIAAILAKKWGLINGWENYTAGDNKNPLGDPVVVWLARAHVLFNDYLVHSAGQPDMFRGAVGKTAFKFQNFSFHQMRAESEIWRKYWDSLDGGTFSKIVQTGMYGVGSIPYAIKDIGRYGKAKAEGLFGYGKADRPVQMREGPQKGNPEAREFQRLLTARWMKTVLYESFMNANIYGQMFIAANSAMRTGVSIANSVRSLAGFNPMGPPKFSKYINEGSMSPMVSLMMRLMFLAIYAGATDEEDDLKAGRWLRLLQGVPLVPMALTSMLHAGNSLFSVFGLVDNPQKTTFGRAAKVMLPVLGETEEIDNLMYEMERMMEDE